MAVTILYFDGCPNWQVAHERAAEALRIVGGVDTIELQRVDTPDEADRIGFAGSPTILIDGHDPFPTESVGFACRLYGQENSPSVAELVRALRS